MTENSTKSEGGIMELVGALFVLTGTCLGVVLICAAIAFLIGVTIGLMVVGYDLTVGFLRG